MREKCFELELLRLRSKREKVIFE